MGLPPGAVGPGATRVFLAIVEANEAGEPPPPLRDIADRVGRYYSAVHAHVGRLERRGLVTRTPYNKRTIRPTLRVVAHTPRKGTR